MDMGPIRVPGTEAANQPAAAPVPAPIASPPPGQSPSVPAETSTAKTVIVVLALLFVYPLGIILMYVLMRWKTWVKILLTLPLILFLVGIAAAAVLIAVDPKGQIQKAECLAQCQQSSDVQGCISQCIEMPNDPLAPSGTGKETLEMEPTLEEPIASPSEEMMKY